MPRPPGRVLAAVFGAALAVHAVLAVRGFHARWSHPDELAQNGIWLAGALGVALVGRLALSFFPPGEPGGHELRALPETWAASLALGWLGLAFAALLYVLLAFRSGEPSTARWLPYLPGALLLVVALARWLTLPGAMVPRHAIAQETFGRAGPWLVAALAGWLASAALTRAFVAALAWLALALILERGLWRARRAAVGRGLFLGAFVSLGFPGSAGRGEEHGLFEEFGVAVALGVGAACLIPWLRRADRRAGLLAAVFLAAPLLVRRDALSWAGLAVYVLSARARQRRFALTAAAACTAAFAWVGWLNPGLPRGRALLADEVLRLALELDAWSLAWPLTLAALALGVLTFPWAPVTWSPGTIEPPRREGLALGVLVGLLAAGLAVPWSPWFEEDALLILFPPLALLAGLLVIPPERASA